MENKTHLTIVDESWLYSCLIIHTHPRPQEESNHLLDILDNYFLAAKQGLLKRMPE